MWRTCAIFLKTWDMALTDCVVSVEMYHLPLMGSSSGYSGCYGPKLEERCVLRRWGFCTHSKIGYHGQVSLLPTQAMGDWAGVLPELLSVSLGCVPCSWSWCCAGQLGACEGTTSSSNENSCRWYGRAFLGESPGRRDIPALNFSGKQELWMLLCFYFQEDHSWESCIF